ncbi:MAG: hypothetical protein QM528_01615 [Phycisphaerales bacterium]|nr:hypothetical protein [Phycisphaerales bacterium]
MKTQIKNLGSFLERNELKKGDMSHINGGAFTQTSSTSSCPVGYVVCTKMAGCCPATNSN